MGTPRNGPSGGPASASARARRACPDLVFVAPRIDFYSEVSKEVMAILRSATPLVEPLSLDEAYLDVSGVESARDVAQQIRARIRAETGLTGVATRTVDSHVKALRSKVGAHRIRTVHGVGYALEAVE